MLYTIVSNVTKFIFCFHPSLKVIHVHGKTGRQVPILLNPKEEAAMEALLK